MAVYDGRNDTTIYDSKNRGYTEPYALYIDGFAVPITPSKINYDQTDRTETIYLADDTFMVVPHFDGPQTFSFEFRVPKFQESNKLLQGSSGGEKLLPFQVAGSEQTHHQFWSDLLWRLKKEKKKIELVLQRHGTDSMMSEPVYLTEWSYVEDAEKGDDFIFSVTFTDYCEQENQELLGTVMHHLVREKNVRGWTET